MQEQLKWSTNEILENQFKIKKIFFYRVCGTGMGAAACLLKEKGFDVEGADNNFSPPMSDYLESTKIPLYQLSDISKEKLQEYDLIVVGNVVPNGSEDAKQVENSGVPYCSFPAAIGGLVLKNVNVVGIAGTHGKTTTTYFITQLFEKLGEKPGYFIGGVMPGRNSSVLGDGKYFFIESDEYDSSYFEKISKFRLYHLNSMILTSLEFDHADIFNNVEDIKDQFRPTLNELDGVLIYENSFSATNELVDELKNLKTFTYGDSSQSGPVILEQGAEGTTFEVKFSNETLKFKTSVIGKHNILNLSACITYALNEGFSVEKVRNAVESLEMVKRRQEVRGLFHNAIVIDDFAHHPRSVKFTIDTIKQKYPSREVLVVMEPNSATARSNLFQNEFEESLSTADTLIMVKPPRPTSIKSAKDLDCQKIVERLRTDGKDAFYIDNLRDLLDKLNDYSKKEIVFLILSNGTCLDLWKSEFVSELKKL